MQRTVKGTRFIYAKTDINEAGEIVVEKATIEIPEANEKKALKLAVKSVGMFKPLKVESFEKLYILDDAIFFKYATEAKKPTEAEAEAEAEAVEG